MATQQATAKTNDYWTVLEEQDRASILHPFTALKDFAEGKQRPRIVTGGKGVFIRDQDGRELLDGFAGLYCVNIGYGRADVAEAIARQAHELAYYHSYAGASSEALIRLSDRLVKMAPGRMSKVFFGLSGSDANETQAKLVWYYNNLLGRPRKKKIIARERGYHGCSVVSGSMTGLSFYHDFMDLPVRTYSSGMVMRLGFAMATAIRPQILLMDEWFMAGDAEFREKAQGRLEHMVRGAQILVLSTHDMAVVQTWCTRVLWLDQGRIQRDGAPDDVLAVYLGHPVRKLEVEGIA